MMQALRMASNFTRQQQLSEDDEKRLFSAANTGINFSKYDEIPVDVRTADGSAAPPPINHFNEATVHPYVKANVDRCKYTTPTPIQKYALPTLRARRDLMACAQTGSGKTAAFMFPIINHILDGGPAGVRAPVRNEIGKMMHFPAAVVLAPTRELCNQIYEESVKFTYRTGLKVCKLYGGRENYSEQLGALRGGVHIVVACPGRLLDVVERGSLDLSNVRYFVLDEADRMLDMGFEPQVRRVCSMMPPKTERLTGMFSATFPRDIQRLARDFLQPDFVHVSVGRVGSTTESIQQVIEWVDDFDKDRALKRYLENVHRDDKDALVLIFCETKRRTDEIAYGLARGGRRALPIHGDMTQVERERNLAHFRSKKCNVLVATSVASRGLDIPDVKHVINFDMPNDIDEYVHRIGRTGRVGRTGIAMSFMNAKNQYLAVDLIALMEESKQEVPDWLFSFSAHRSASAAPNRGGGPRVRRVGGGGGDRYMFGSLEM